MASESTPAKTFLQALHERYSPSEPDSNGEKTIELSEGVKFEFVGFKEAEAHISKLDRLRQVSLFDMTITTLKVEDNAFPAPNIEELDLSLNLVDSWDEIFELSKRLPRLQLLQLSSNPLRTIPRQVCQVSCLKTLVLNKTETQWDKIVSLQSYFPNLEELHLCFNGIKSLTLESDSKPSDTFKKLTLLNLEGNQLVDWNQIKSQIGAISSLETLFLGGNPIEEISPAAENEFTSLRFISLARTQIKSWDSIEAIRKSGWKELRLQEVPLTESLPTSLVARNVLIARVPTLTKLNGSEISVKERTDAEIFYLKMYATLPPEIRREQHPLYDALLQRYTESVLTTNTSNTKMRSELIPIAFKYEEEGQPKTADRSLPASTTVGILKTIASQIARIPIQEVQLQHEGSVLDDDEVSLGYWRALYFVIGISRRT